MTGEFLCRGGSGHGHHRQEKRARGAGNAEASHDGVPCAIRHPLPAARTAMAGKRPFRRSGRNQSHSLLFAAKAESGCRAAPTGTTRGRFPSKGAGIRLATVHLPDDVRTRNGPGRNLRSHGFGYAMDGDCKADRLGTPVHPALTGARGGDKVRAPRAAHLADGTPIWLEQPRTAAKGQGDDGLEGRRPRALPAGGAMRRGGDRLRRRDVHEAAAAQGQVPARRLLRHRERRLRVGPAPPDEPGGSRRYRRRRPGVGEAAQRRAPREIRPGGSSWSTPTCSTWTAAAWISCWR